VHRRCKAIQEEPAENAGKFVERYARVYRTTKKPIIVVDGFSRELAKGEFVTAIGHSGCGKSTMLSMIAALNEISSARSVLDGRCRTIEQHEAARQVRMRRFAIEQFGRELR
jgi:ABC-type lipoprotein export system ATPase subunit